MLNEPLVNATPLPTDMVNQEVNKPVKQVGTGCPNPTGKGGFQDHPELINKEGRPKEPTLTEYLREELGVTTNSGVTGYQELSRIILRLARGYIELMDEVDDKGNPKKIKHKPNTTLLLEAWHYIDGLPKQTIKNEGEMTLNTNLQIYKPEKLKE